MKMWNPNYGPRFNYDGRCGNFGKYVLVFTNNTLIKACKIGEIYTQFENMRL